MWPVLLDQLDIQKAAVAGHSMGGYVALAFAHVYPRRVLGLGLVSSQALADPPERKAARYQEAEHVLAKRRQGCGRGNVGQVDHGPVPADQPESAHHAPTARSAGGGAAGDGRTPGFNPLSAGF